MRLPSMAILLLILPSVKFRVNPWLVFCLFFCFAFACYATLRNIYKNKYSFTFRQQIRSIRSKPLVF
jgi:hypothetical protein